LAIKGGLLVVEWSPTQVHVYDPSTGQSNVAASLAECLIEARGREAVIGVSRRSCFVRSLYVPNASRNEIEGILRVQLEGILPFAPNEYVLAFRLGAFIEGKGRLAAVGAIKSDALQRIADEAKACGIRVRAILPVAYGSWMVARAHSLTDALVVEASGEALNLDVIKGGELHYSRTVPLSESPEDIEDEIARTYAVSDAMPSPIVAVATPDIAAGLREDRSPAWRLSDPVGVTRLFSFEPPNQKQAQLDRSGKWKSWRAIAAAGLAVGAGGYAYSVRTRLSPKPTIAETKVAASLSTAKREQTKLGDELTRVQRAERILDAAFKPSQTMSDMAVALSGAATEGAWFTSLNLSRSAPLSVSGLGLHDKDVTDFMGNLTKDKRFEGMKVVSTSRTAISDTPLTQFYVTGSPVGVMPFDRPLKEKDVKTKL
jgi:Tfp pilus assembly protein PilN